MKLHRKIMRFFFERSLDYKVDYIMDNIHKLNITDMSAIKVPDFEFSYDIGTWHNLLDYVDLMCEKLDVDTYNPLPLKINMIVNKDIHNSLIHLAVNDGLISDTTADDLKSLILKFSKTKKIVDDFDTSIYDLYYNYKIFYSYIITMETIINTTYKLLLSKEL